MIVEGSYFSPTDAASLQRPGLSALSMSVELYGSRSSRSPLVEWLLVEQNTPYKHREDREGMPNPFGQIPALRDGEVEVFESGAILLYLAGMMETSSIALTTLLSPLTVSPPLLLNHSTSEKRQAQHRADYSYYIPQYPPRAQAMYPREKKRWIFPAFYPICPSQTRHRSLMLVCALSLCRADKYGDAKTPEERAKYTKWVVWANAALDKSLFTPDIDRRAPPLLSVLESHLATREYLVDKFSVADVAVCSYLSFIPMFHPNFQLAPFPTVLKYMGRCLERPSFLKAFSANGPRAQAYVKDQMAKGGGPKKAFGFM